MDLILTLHRMKTKLENKIQKGFTLLETLLYITLTTIIIGAISTFITVTMQVQATNFAVSEVEQTGNQAMGIISFNIRNATLLNSPTIGDTTSSLSVNVANSAINPTVLTIYGSRITMQEASNAVIFLTPTSVNVTNLSFQNVSQISTKSSIKIQFTINYANPNGSRANTYSKIFYGSANIR